LLTRRGHEATDAVRYLAGDLRTDEGVAAAVDGVTAIVHCATSTKGDVDATRHLVQAASRAGSPHLAYVSIVGVEHLPWGYPKAKLQAERVVAESGLPWTILRATQFYDYLLAGLRRMARLPVVPVPAGSREPARCAPAVCCHHHSTPPAAAPGSSSWPRTWIDRMVRSTGARFLRTAPANSGTPSGPRTVPAHRQVPCARALPTWPPRPSRVAAATHR
jgi:hypothetical protein